MKLLLSIFLTIVSSAITYAGEIEVGGGVSPTGQYEIVLLTHAPYSSNVDGAPGVVLRDVSTNAVVGFFVWPGDVSDPNAPGQTEAHWNPDGRHVAITVQAGRAMRSTSVYAISSGGLQLLLPAPLSEDTRKRYFSTQRPSNGGTVFRRWIDDRTIEIHDNAYNMGIVSHISADNELEVVSVNDGK